MSQGGSRRPFPRGGQRCYPRYKDYWDYEQNYRFVARDSPLAYQFCCVVLFAPFIFVQQKCESGVGLPVRPARPLDCSPARLNACPPVVDVKKGRAPAQVPRPGFNAPVTTDRHCGGVRGGGGKGSIRSTRRDPNGGQGPELNEGQEFRKATSRARFC
ncbi:hypothetical protein RR46_01227 [Papilio xuthus]|uniref:Uncharacterized protein n=1 Tax=Papilio xuthus TaxID=66420 RepID=A0A0N0PA54_PAPXU|nr:hypothetical protein RR46_01227 [Papilio xuthus]